MAAAAALHPPSDGFKATFRPTPRFSQEERQDKRHLHVLLEEAERLKCEPPLVDVDTWPRYLNSPLAWTGQDFEDPCTYTY